MGSLNSLLYIRRPFLLCSLFREMPEGEKIHFRLFAHLQLIMHDYEGGKIAMKDISMFWTSQSSASVRQIRPHTLHRKLSEDLPSSRRVNYPKTQSFHSNTEYSFPERLIPGSTGDNGWVHPFILSYFLYDVSSKDIQCQIICLIRNISWTASNMGGNTISVGWVISCKSLTSRGLNSTHSGNLQNGKHMTRTSYFPALTTDQNQEKHTEEMKCKNTAKSN